MQNSEEGRGTSKHPGHYIFYLLMLFFVLKALHDVSFPLFFFYIIYRGRVDGQQAADGSRHSETIEYVRFIRWLALDDAWLRLGAAVFCEPVSISLFLSVSLTFAPFPCSSCLSAPL